MKRMNFPDRRIKRQKEALERQAKYHRIIDKDILSEGKKNGTKK